MEEVVVNAAHAGVQLLKPSDFLVVFDHLNEFKVQIRIFSISLICNHKETVRSVSIQPSTFFSTVGTKIGVP